MNTCMKGIKIFCGCLFNCTAHTYSIRIARKFPNIHVSQTLFEDALQDQMKREARGFGWRNWLVNVRELTRVPYEIM